jgi:hypothetical protein
MTKLSKHHFTVFAPMRYHAFVIGESDLEVGRKGHIKAYPLQAASEGQTLRVWEQAELLVTGIAMAFKSLRAREAAARTRALSRALGFQSAI